MNEMNYTAELYDFLGQLAENNNRPWFHEHKEQYDRLRALWMRDVDSLLALMSEWEPGLRSQTAASSVYRFYRDIRFSPDKSPYKLFFSAAFSPWGKKTRRACYYLQMGLDVPDREIQSGLYAGMWCPDSAMLRKVRNAIVDNDDEFAEIVQNPELERLFPGFEIGAKLKTVPRGYDKAHRFAEVLKMKDIGKFCHADRSFFMRDDWVEETSRRFSLLKPMVDFINYSLDE